jgi:large subunit ribosomal protein L10
MARADRVAAVTELTDRFRESGSVVLTEYRGLSVSQLRALRQSLGDNATFSVVKNTLTKIAVSEVGLQDQLAPLLSGPSAIAFVGGDVVEAAKGLRDFSRDNPALVIKGGVLDGKALTPDEITRLADLEPREVLLARLAGAMTASMSRAAAVFNALPTQVAQLLEALRVQRAEQGGDEGGQEAAPEAHADDAGGQEAAPEAPADDAGENAGEPTGESPAGSGSESPAGSASES